MKFLSAFLLACLIFIIPATEATAQDSSHMRVSLLTCTPGEELYSTFGHSAIRIVDSSSVTDYVYNYGTFNFDDKNFYLKFMRGKLLYYISVEPFNDGNGYYGFKSSYQLDHRGITEQVLNLSAAEKINIQHLLNENLKEENRYYKYDFFLDNCTTRLRDIILQSKQPTPVLPAVMPVTTTFRNAIHVYLDKNKQYWSKLGIDILLGAPTDAVMTAAQQQFLPDNLMTALDSSRNVRVVQSSASLYPLPSVSDEFSWFTPVVFFSILLLVFVLTDLSSNKWIRQTGNGLDGFLFFMVGLLGVLLLFMMTATDHSMTRNNYNILWAWPTHLIISFFMNSRRKFVKMYFLVTSVCLVILLLAWFFLPQQMSGALIPFVVLLLYRSVRKYMLS
ncbi:MAG: DUF4105 domain-containing protein [Bacteroidetes bacterium]|nr:DUF4105 domain-containing protein [Bacteroidota bacterium]